MLFLCAHNSARSILAEHLVNHFLGDQFKAFSAGLEAVGVNPHARRVLAELGIDTTTARSKLVDEFKDIPFDTVVTVCSPAEGACPVWLGAGEKLHIPFQDPARAEEGEEENLQRFRRVRDEMRSRLLPRLAGAANLDT